MIQRGGLLALSASVWPSWMPRLVFREDGSQGPGDVLIVVFAGGGYDGLNMIIPYGDEANYKRLRPTLAIPGPEATGAQRRAADLDGFFGMHPALVERGWKHWFDEGVLGIVHAMHMDNPTRSHFDATDYMQRGTPGEKKLHSGWLGRHLSTMATGNDSPFRGVGMGTMLQPMLRGPVPAITLQSISEFHLQGRQSEIDRFEQHLETLYAGDGWLEGEGQSTFAAIKMLEESLGDDDYVPENGADYSRGGSLGNSLKQVAQLIKADIGLEVACVDYGGWDTHANEVERDDPTTGFFNDHSLQLAGGIDAFIRDLGPRFDPDDKDHRGVTVVVMTEFGRRAYENGGLGTDHGHGNAMFLFGKGIVGGKVHLTEWPGLNDDQLDRGDLAGTTEYRDILGEILDKRLGNRSIDVVFPNHAFNFLNLAVPLDYVVPTPTPGPTEPAATPTPTSEVPSKSELYIPWASR
jgi:uncharacterized protein (DUF1501 family)